MKYETSFQKALKKILETVDQQGSESTINIDKLSTDEIMQMLPPFINIKGDLYHFKLIKGHKRIIVSYQDEAGESFSPTYWAGKTIHEALSHCLSWLIEYKYLKVDE